MRPQSAQTAPADRDGRPADWRTVLDDLVCDFEDQWSVGPRPSVEEFVAARLRPEAGTKSGPEPGPKIDEVRRFVAVAELAKAEFELSLTQQGDQRAQEWLERYEPLRALPALATDMFVTEYQHRQQHSGLSLTDFLPQVPADLRDAVAARLAQPSRYAFDKQVGAGGQGEVWEGFDRELQRPVAVKVVRPEAQSADTRRRLVSEARVTSQLEHPGVVPVYGLEEHSQDGRPRYAMRYVRGETLTQRIKRYHQLRQAEAAPSGFRLRASDFGRRSGAGFRLRASGFSRRGGWGVSRRSAKSEA